MVESFIINIAASVVYDLSKVAAKFSLPSKSKYEIELIQVIMKSIEDFKKRYPITDRTKISFCDSEILFSELIRFRFSKGVDIHTVLEKVNSDTRLHNTSKDELLQFLEIFDSYLEVSANFREVAMNKDYKEEISKMTNLIEHQAEEITLKLEKQTKEIKDEISNLKITGTLKSIWSQQIDEIREYLKEFKVYTAMDRLEKLENQIIDHGGFLENNLKAKFLFLKAVCEQEVNYGEPKNNHHELFIRAWKLNPDILEYKIRAAVAFYSCNNDKEAKKLVDLILEESPYDESAWMIKSFTSDNPKDYIVNEVPLAVKKKQSFKVLAGYRLFSKGIVILPSELKAIDLELDFQSIIVPEAVTFNNKDYWRLVAQLCISKFDEQNPVKRLFRPYSGLEKDLLFNLTNQLLTKSVSAFKGSEVELKYTFLEFQLHYTNFHISGDKSHAHKMEIAYNKLKSKTPIQVYQLSQIITYDLSEAQTRKAIKLITEYGETRHEILAFTKSTLHFSLEEDDASWVSFKEFLKLNMDIDEETLCNVLQYFNLLISEKDKNISEKVNFVLKNNKFSKKEYKDLFKLFAAVVCNVPMQDIDTKQKIDELSIIFNKKNSLAAILGQIIIKTKNYSKAESYLSTFINLEEPDSILIYYCQTLFFGRLKILKLLEILKYWREHFIPVKQLLDFEMSLSILQNNKSETFEIVKKAVDFFPKDEVFLRYYFFSLAYYGKIDTVKAQINLLNEIEFKNESNGLHVASILKELGFTKRSLDLIYSLAKEKKNTKSRQSYFSLFLLYPDEVHKTYEKVKEGTLVKIKIDENIKIVEVTTGNQQSKMEALLLGRVVDDTFKYPTPLQKVKEVEVKVLKIMDRYVALFETIMLESEDPTEGIPIRSFDLPMEGTIEEINNALIKEFGEEEEIRKAGINKLLEKFYKAQFTFTEILTTLYVRKNILGYLYLTAKHIKNFRVLSPAFARNKPFNNQTKFIIDGTSLCLFYDLYLENKISFDHKFIISSFLKRELELIIEDIEISPTSNISINISSTEVIPTVYPDNFKEIRLNYFRGMLDWINNQCEVDYVDEKLEGLLKLNDKMEKNSDGFDIIFMDNSFLAIRENHILLSNDLHYFKTYGGNLHNKIISPEVYLDTFHSKKNIEYLSYFLEKKYVGTKTNSQIIYKEFIKRLGGEENNFDLCLQNLQFNWNPNPANIDEALMFLKKVLLLSFLNLECKMEITTSILSNLIIGMKEENISYLKNMIKEEFEKMIYFREDILLVTEYFEKSFLRLKNMNRRE